MPDHLLFFLQNPAHPKQTRKIPPAPAASDLVSGTLKLFSAFHFSTLHYFNVMLLHVREIPHLFLHSTITPGLRNSKPPTPKRSLKCNLKSNLLFLSKILENCTSAVVAPQWEHQFQSREGFGNLSEPQKCFASCFLPAGKLRPSLARNSLGLLCCF